MEQKGDWDGTKAPWGCLWMKMWECNVQALVACEQRAIVIHQTANEFDGTTGKHMGLGNAQRAELGS